MSVQKIFFSALLFYLLLDHATLAQLKFFPIGHQQSKTVQRKKLTEDTVFTTLPFFEDFADIGNFPNPTKWQIDETTPYVSSGFGINPPSIFMATFDGAKANGERYNDTNLLSTGEADALTSVFFDLSTYQAADSLFISFYWQAEGLGEKPTEGDQLRLQYRDRNGNWNTLWEENGNADTVIFPFEQEQILLEDTAAFHSYFAFRFQNSGRLSGGFDTWNLDYIFFYEQGQRIDSDLAMSDQTTSLLKNYYAMPIQQFRQTELADTVFSSIQNNSDDLHIFAPTLQIKDLYTGNNLGSYRVEALGNFSFQPGDTTFVIDERENMQLIAFNNDNELPIEDYDSLDLEYTFYYDTIPAERFFIGETAQANTLSTFPNDTLRSKVQLKDYYAYDDGVSEYVVGIFQNFGQVAYRFVLNEPDFITAIDMYFPQIADNLEGRSFNLLVWDKLDFEDPNNDQVVSRLGVPFVYTDSINVFRRLELREPVFLTDTFYVGYEQLTDEPLLVGWDRNTNTAENIFFNVNAAWEQNPDYNGSMMIRPVFDAENPINSIDEDLATLQSVQVWPNPTKGQLFIEGEADSYQLVDITGKLVLKGTLEKNIQKTIELPQGLNGLFLLVLRKNNSVFSKKILVER